MSGQSGDRMKKIGIMGGTFNPIHCAHMEMARCALVQKKLDEIWFMPSKIPPHKSKAGLLDEETRAKLVRLAVEEEERFVFSDFELKRNETTYTAKTLELLHGKYPEVSWYFILGGDSLFSFHEWYHPEQIARYATILAVSRDGVDDKRMCDQAQFLSEKYQGEFCVLTMQQMDISSSKIRDRLSKGISVKEDLPPKVNAFIQEHRLYH